MGLLTICLMGLARVTFNMSKRTRDNSIIAKRTYAMGSEAAQVIYKERAATAECVNAQCRNRGLLRFLVRGLEKAKAVGLWHALAHNMICTGRLLAT